MCEKHSVTLQIKLTTVAELVKIPIQAYEACFADWKSCWHHCVSRDGKSKEIYQSIDIPVICLIYREKYIDIFDILEEIYRQFIFS